MFSSRDPLNIFFDLSVQDIHSAELAQLGSGFAGQNIADQELMGKIFKTKHFGREVRNNFRTELELGNRAHPSQCALSITWVKVVRHKGADFVVENLLDAGSAPNNQGHSARPTAATSTRRLECLRNRARATT